MDELMSAFAGMGTSSNGEMVRKFAEVMKTSEDIATFFLEASAWNVESALNSYLSSVGDQSNLVAQIGQVPQASAGIIDPMNALNSQLLPNQPFQLQWVLTNTGTCPWPQNSTLVHTEGPKLNGPKSANVGIVQQGQMVNQTLSLAAPSQPGQYASTWRLKYNGGYFGDAIWIITNVVTPPPGAPTFPTQQQQQLQQQQQIQQQMQQHQQMQQQQQQQQQQPQGFMGLGNMNIGQQQQGQNQMQGDDGDGNVNMDEDDL